MATVYLAEDLKHKRKVALKVLKPELAAVLGAERFVQEITTTAALQHPHILPLFDSGSVYGPDKSGPYMYYVMPFIQGETLRSKLDRETQLGIDEAVRITVAVADALDYAHRQGVIHRDIKPENILLHEGRPMVADFGIALAVQEAGGQRMTQTGLSLGTPQYMSPEQAMGERSVDARSDIYALGAVTYEMLTGEPPFSGATVQAIMAKVLTKRPTPPSAVRDTVPAAMEAAVLKALAKLPADRFRSATDFSEALIRPGVIPLTTSAALPAGGRRFSVVGWLAGAVVVAGIAGGFLVGRTTAPTAPTKMVQFQFPPPDSAPGFSRCCGVSLALSPDGTILVLLAGGTDGPLYRREVGHLEAKPIPGTDGGSIPFFSPDGRWLGFYSHGKIRKVSMAGGPPIPITDAAVPVSGPSWGKDDRIVYVSGRRLYSVGAGGGVGIPIPVLDSTTYYDNTSQLPGGKALLVSFRQPSGGAEPSQIGVLDLSSGAVDTLGHGVRALYALGYLVFAGADNTLLAQPFDLASRRTAGQAAVFLEGVRIDGVVGAQFTLSGNGALAYHFGAPGSAETLQLVGPNGRTTVVLPEPGELDEPVFSPDGERIALRLATPSRNDIWVFNREQGTLERLTTEGQSYFPIWTLDRRRVAYQSVREGAPAAIYWSPADGSGSAELLFAASYHVLPSSWLPGGRSLVFTATGRPGTGNDIGVIAVGDTIPRWLIETSFNERQPHVSPDGRWLAYTSDRSGEAEVYVQAMSGEGGRVQVSTSGGHSPRWAPDGRTLYFVSNAQVIAATVADGGEFRVAGRATRFMGVTDINEQNSNYDIHPNGTEFLIINQQGDLRAQMVWITYWPEILRAKGTAR